MKEANKKPKHQSALYEVRTASDEGIVFQRVISTKGRSKKEIAETVKDLPTATIHSFTEEEFNKLKKLEEELYSQMKYSDEESSFKNKFLSFMGV